MSEIFRQLTQEYPEFEIESSTFFTKSSRIVELYKRRALNLIADSSDVSQVIQIKRIDGLVSDALYARLPGKNQFGNSPKKGLFYIFWPLDVSIDLKLVLHIKYDSDNPISFLEKDEMEYRFANNETELDAIFDEFVKERLTPLLNWYRETALQD